MTERLQLTAQTTTLPLLKRNIVVVPLFLPQENLSFIAAKTTAWFVHTMGNIRSRCSLMAKPAPRYASFAVNRVLSQS